jgi:hypothetical protein
VRHLLVSFAINGLRGDLEEGPYTKTETDVSGHAARRASLIKDRIVNAINYLHFQGRSVYAVFRHRLYRTTVTVEAFPLPCQKDYLYLAWKEQGKLKERSSSYEMQHVLISAGRRIFSLRPDLVDIDDTSIRFDVSKAVGTDVTVRKVERYPCQEIHVEVIQNSISFRGKLYDFSAFSFSATLSLQNFLSFKYINPDIAVTVFIKKGEELLLSRSPTIFTDSSRRHTGVPVIDYTPPQTSSSRTRSRERPYRLR